MAGTPYVQKNRAYEIDHPDQVTRAGNEKCKEFVRTDFWLRVESGSVVNAWQLGLRTIDTLLFTPQGGSTDPYYATAWTFGPKMFENYATIFIWDNDGSQVSGSVWLCGMATGE